MISRSVHYCDSRQLPSPRGTSHVSLLSLPSFINYFFSLITTLKRSDLPYKMSASGDWGPAPAGIDLTETKDGEILRPVIALMTLGILAVALRLVARHRSGTSIAIDDYLILLALVSHSVRQLHHFRYSD
jgi:hypothetical protein